MKANFYYYTVDLNDKLFKKLKYKKDYQKKKITETKKSTKIKMKNVKKSKVNDEVESNGSDDYRDDDMQRQFHEFQDSQKDPEMEIDEFVEEVNDEQQNQSLYGNTFGNENAEKVNKLDEENKQQEQHQKVDSGQIKLQTFRKYDSDESTGSEGEEDELDLVNSKKRKQQIKRQKIQHKPPDHRKRCTTRKVSNHFS